MKLKEDFIWTWQKYFNNAELPMTFYYTDEEGHANPMKSGAETLCIMAPLVKVRRGARSAFSAESGVCPGG
jgi:hypothetical protein